ncbi:DHA2 family efflux MFS transporter permease subunit [Companilactobacillus pabuli]|jgi:EmrB/QacA subfamily drug resistance transporter|uniref:Multidrug efflux MFS transporter n=1 Tax=Companilactobacillus pabuli TaxID=2714036 RepID=A0A7L7KTW6_9LACO|nr:DHA2 family efflux MFS transporter permease subunit [Companilactobacillus pabuli]AKP03171.1 MFS transporter [Companilactobacillus farciminis]AKS51471.1 MFS transporter [Companilactobacillus farciminis]QMT83233.1 multidrug efflux MFS transporter [Companilactobacillus pabuli]GAQ01549.1 MFS transporter [Companilactobacillus farciminis]
MREQKIPFKVILAVIATGLMSFCGVIVETSMNISFPTLMKEFNVTTSTVQWMTTIYLLVVAIIVPLSSFLKKNFKTKSLFLCANLLFILGLVIDAIAPIFPILLLGRTIQGLGTGIALPLMFNIILENVPTSKIGLMMGIGTLITAVAPAVGPTFGGLVISGLGWRYIFVILVPILIISFFLGIKNIEQKSQIQKTAFDLLSLIYLIFTFAGLIYGFSNMSNFNLLIALSFIIGILGLIGFVTRSRKIEHPLINISILKNLKFSGHVLSFFLFQVLSLGFAFILPNYIQLVNSQSATIAGMAVLPAGVVGAIFAPLGGKILDKFGARLPILFGVTFADISLLVFTLLSRNLSTTVIVWVYILYMCGMGMSSGNIMTDGLNLLPDKNQADGNAVFNTLQQFAGATGTSIVSAIIALSQSNHSLSTKVSTAIGTQHAFIILLIIGLINLFILYKAIPSNTQRN